MKNLKKALKIAGLVLLIVLASFGAGLTGALVPFSRKRDNTVEIKIELVEPREDKTDALVVDFFE